MEIGIKKLDEKAVLPTFGSEAAAGADLYALPEGSWTIQPGQTVMIPTGLAMEIPVGYAGFIFARSGLASKKGLAPANKVGVIDADYRGEVMVALHNHSQQSVNVTGGERVAQLVILQVPTVSFVQKEQLSDSLRGIGGFGSTGK